MTIATVTTDINIGPFKIPSNGQSMIMNNYAQRNNLAVELTIPEPLMSNHFATVLWLHEEINLSKLILTSFHQLPKRKDRKNILIKKMSNVEFHFALEGFKGKGSKFLLDAIKESEIFMKSKILDSTKTSWSELYNMMINDKK